MCGKKITSMQNNGMQLLINELTSMGVGAGVVIKPSLKLGEAWVIYIPSFYVEVITYLWNDINDISDMDPPREINYTVLKSVSRRKLRDPPPRGTSGWHRAFDELSFGEFAQESSAFWCKKIAKMFPWHLKLFGSVTIVHKTICSCHTRFERQKHGE